MSRNSELVSSVNLLLNMWLVCFHLV